METLPCKRRIRNADSCKFFIGQVLPSLIQCRFVHAPNAREWLNTSRSMMVYALTYHQVMPSFLDFLFPFGRQEHARDFHFSGFRHETHLEPSHRGLQSPTLGRSGRAIRMSYSLKSVEQSDGQVQWPWSIRQTAIYHSLDVETGVTSWIIVKGNQLMQRRMESVTASRNFCSANGFNTAAEAYCSSLALHLVICDWCGEDWRWYISFLEELLQEKTRRTLAVPLDEIPSPVMHKPSQALSWSTMSSTVPEKRLPSHPVVSDKQAPMAPPESPPGPPPPPPGRPKAPGMPASQGAGPYYDGNFTFGDLPRVQRLEDKANEVLLILESNINVLTELEQHYDFVQDNLQCLGGSWSEFSGRNAEVSRFKNRVASIINDLRMQQSRTKTLLRLVADRKSLVSTVSLPTHLD